MISRARGSFDFLNANLRSKRISVSTEPAKSASMSYTPFFTSLEFKDQAENNFRFLGQPWPSRTWLLSSRSWR
jgi:hypothetical protein